jgi:hypothetical protein
MHGDENYRFSDAGLLVLGFRRWLACFSSTVLVMYMEVEHRGRSRASTL